ncbi:MAG: hypothetical protein JNL10_19200 [Verrucomicrobiales bacterium]|nr:hypothetical protein [Verrucomicrobiales bacterium]
MLRAALSPLIPLAPVFLRELRLSHRRVGNWRTNWKWVITVLGASAMVVGMVHQSVSSIWHLAQFISPLASAVMMMMPLGFAADRQAGHQALLRLTGLGPFAVFGASVAGSLCRLMELWLFSIPVMLVAMRMLRVRPQIALLHLAILGAFLVWLATLRILGVAVARTRSGTIPIAIAAAACLFVPIALETWGSKHLGPGLNAVLQVAGGIQDWAELHHASRVRASTAPLWRVLARLGFWIVLWLGIAAWCFRRDWLAAEDGQPSESRWRRWLRRLARDRDTSATRVLSENLPYRIRFPTAGSWRAIEWGLAAVLGIAAIALTVTVSWRVLPFILVLAVSLVDMIAHVAVSIPVAEDRQAGVFELLFTTPLRPAGVLSAADRSGRDIVRTAIPPGLTLAALAAALAVWQVPPADRATHHEWILLVSQFSWPISYALGLAFLPFRLPASQAANTGEPFHAYSPPPTAVMMPIVAGLGVWGIQEFGPEAQLGIAIGGTLFWVIMLLVREQIAASKGLNDEEFRTVAAAPLPPEGFREKDTRNTKPWVPEDFHR